MQGFYSFSGKEEEDPLAEVSKQTLAILNKLTPQKFDALIVKFNQIKIDSEEKLRKCIDLVFDKVSLSSYNLCQLFPYLEDMKKILFPIINYLTKIQALLLLCRLWTNPVLLFSTPRCAKT